MSARKTSKGGGAGDGVTEEQKELQNRWLQMMEDNKLDEFENLLQNGQVDPKYKYFIKKNKGKSRRNKIGTCLEIASGMPGKGRFVRVLLDNKIRPTVNVIVPEPIHRAARTAADDVMAELVIHKKIDVNATNSVGDTPLHYLAKYYQPTKEYKRCLSLLLNHPDIDINKANKLGYTIIHQAAFHKKKEMVEEILNRFRNSLDLDTYAGHGRTAREFLKLNYPDLVPTLPSNRNKLSMAYSNQLLEAFHNGHLQLFQSLLHQTDEDGNSVFDVNYRYGQPPNETILDMACKEEGYKEFIEILLKAGTNPNRLNPISKKVPILIAAENVNVGAIQALIEDGTVNTSVMDHRGWSAVHFATAACASQSRQLEQQQRQQQQNQVPINTDEARKNLQNQFKNCITLLLKNIQVDLNDIITKTNLVDRVLEEILRDVSKTTPLMVNGLSITTGITQPTVTKEDWCQKLLFHLQNEQTGEFICEFQKCDKTTVKCKLPEYLQVAIESESDMTDVVEELLKCDKTDPNAMPEGKLPPLILAVKHNKWKIVQMLLDKPGTRVNITDIKGDTALHYAAREKFYHIIPDLLNHGADINHTNSLEKTAFSPTTLEVLLDNSLKTSEKYYPKHPDFGVTFDYSFVTASKTEYRSLGKHTVVTVNQQQCAPMVPTSKMAVGLKAESEILYFLSENYQDYSHLFYHPIVNSFLQFKWDCVKHFFYFNIFVYLFFFIILNFHIMYNPAINVTSSTNATVSKSSNHTNCYFIDRSSDDVNITEYSIENSIYGFNDTKCYMVDHSNKLQNSSESYVPQKLVECSEIIKYCYNVNTSSIEIKDRNSTIDSSDTNGQFCLRCILWFLTACFLLREILQLALLRLSYLCNIENYLDLSVVGITITLLLLPKTDEYVPVCYIYAVLLSSCELILLLGREPIFSRSIEMLKTVIKSYLSLLLVFLLIILAFAHCLYIVFRKNMEGTNMPVVLWVFCRTIVLMTGEYEATDLDFSTMPITSTIVFLLFVFFISIVLLNLLIALSVNDTNRIAEKSEIVCVASRINLIYDIENIMLRLHKMFPSLNSLTQSVMCFPDLEKEKTVIALQNQDGKLKNNPTDNSALRRTIYHPFRRIKSILKFCCRCFCYFSTDKCKKYWSYDGPRMDKNNLKKAMKLTGVKIANEKNKTEDIKDKLRELLQNLEE